MGVQTEELYHAYKSSVFQDYCKSALGHFHAFQWPTMHDEQWRRTDMGYLDLESLEAWNAALEHGVHQSAPDHAGEYLLSSDASISIANDSKGVEIRDARFELSASAFLEQLRLGYLEVAEHKFSAWNATWASCAPTVRIHKNVQCEKPVYIKLELSSEQVVVNSQIHIIVEAGAKASVILSLDSKNGGELLHNCGVLSYLGDNASLELFVAQEDNIDASFVGSFYNQLHNDARLKFVAMNKGAMMAKYTVYSDIHGKGSEALMDGVFYPHNDEHIDIRSVQRHRVGKSYSRALFKGAVTDTAHSVFQGLIHVDPEANDTDAYLTNNNLVLSDSARSDSIPTLQIETNDLRCSHGATIGKIDQEQLGYLCTRGLSPELAKSMLVEGHFEEIVSLFPEDISDALRTQLLV